MPVAKALRDGGIAAMEITLRTPCACDAITAVLKAYPDMLVGAGTVLTPEQVQEACDAGATYIVTPGYNPKVVQTCVDNGILIMPGIDSPTGIELALEAGLPAVKFFPAAHCGGIKGLRAMAGPFRDRMKFLPLGGITPENLTDYARCEKVLAVGGTWIAKSEIINSGDFERITRNAREAMALLHGFELAGVELQVGDVKADFDLLGTLSTVFTPRPGVNALAALTEGDFSGRIRIACNNVKRAALWLKAQNFEAVERETESGLSMLLQSRPGNFEIEFIQK